MDNKFGVSPPSSREREFRLINNDITSQNLLANKESDTMIPHYNDFQIDQKMYQQETKTVFMTKSPFESPQTFMKQEMYTFSNGNDAPQRHVTKFQINMSKAQKMADIDIEKMIESDSEDDNMPHIPPPNLSKMNQANVNQLLPPRGIVGKPEDYKFFKDETNEEAKDEIRPLPRKNFDAQSRSKIPSHIKTKKIRYTFNNKDGGTFQRFENNSDAYDRDIFGGLHSNINANNQNFQNVGGFNAKYSKFNGPNYKSEFRSFPPGFESVQDRIDMLRNNYGRFDPEISMAPVQKHEEQAPEIQANLYENLKYGSVLTLNLKVDDDADKKISTKLRISDRVNANKMGKDDYNVNCLWKIIPASQHLMQDKILDIIEKDEVPLNIEIEFDNFSSEAKANSDNYEITKGLPVKYEDTFQLYHESSKRFLCFYPCKVSEIERLYNGTYCDSECYYLGCNEYSNTNTHFSFSTVANYQQEEDGSVKKYHFVYLTMVEKAKTHYLHCVGKSLFLTESYKVPLTMNVMRDPSDVTNSRTVSRTDVALISFANDNFYLNVPQKLNMATGRYEEQEVEFQRWQDPKSIDFNGWWQIDVLEESSTIQLRNFNTGHYIKLAEKITEGSPFELTGKPEEAQTFELTAINTDEKDVGNFTESNIFKIKVHKPSKIIPGDYLSIEPRDDSDYMFYEDTNFDKKRVVLSQASYTNTLDTFKIIIPKEEEYLELSLCIDSREYIDSF